MTETQYFSKYYSEDSTRYEDKDKFRNRVIMYLHDEVQKGSPRTTYTLCRQKLGINIPISTVDPVRHAYRYEVEKTFNQTNISVSDILDFISVVFDSWEQGKKDNETFFKKMQEQFIEKINEIFQEESMCYVLHENGLVRYYPDNEFFSLIKSTLTTLNNPNYSEQLETFNSILDDFYKNRNTESPIQKLHKFVESFSLSIVGSRFNVLNENATEEMIKKIQLLLKKSTEYTSNDISAVLHFKEQLFKWTKMCHKYRHGKGSQGHQNVPEELFNYIFSSGVSLYRMLINLDEKYSLRN